MTILKVITYGDEILRTPSKEIHKVSSKIQKLIDDMLDTMYANDGVGLAAPQVGHNLRLFIIDSAPADAPLDPLIFINPKIVKRCGAVCSNEGCLSFPDVYIDVRRSESVIIKAKDQSGKPFSLEATCGSLLARAIQHEYDHLEGNLFVDHARNRFEAEQALSEKGLPGIDPDRLIEEPELEEEIAAKEIAVKQETSEASENPA